MSERVGMIVGIDPGYSGALAFLDPYRSLRVRDMPVLPNAKGKTELDILAILKALRPTWHGRSVAVIEKVGTMPGQGISSAFRFGEGVGVLKAAVVGHGYEVHYVTPTVWKNRFGLSKDKGVSRGLAMQRFPGNAELFSRAKDDGRAEAALLALYATEAIPSVAFNQAA